MTRPVHALGALTGLLLMFVCGLLLAADFAKAQTPASLPASDEAALAYAQPIAEQAFDQPHCPHITYELRADEKLDLLAAYWKVRQFAGYAFSTREGFPVPEDADFPLPAQPECTVLLRSLATYPMTNEGYCVTASHELGHVAGWQHQPGDPLMNGTGVLDHEPCSGGATLARRPAFFGTHEEEHHEAEAPKLTEWQRIVQAVHRNLPTHAQPWKLKISAYRAAVAKRTGAWGVAYASSPKAKTPRRYLILVDGARVETMREELGPKAARR